MNAAVYGNFSPDFFFSIHSYKAYVFKFYS